MIFPYTNPTYTIVILMIYITLISCWIIIWYSHDIPLISRYHSHDTVDGCKILLHLGWNPIANGMNQPFLLVNAPLFIRPMAWKTLGRIWERKMMFLYNSRCDLGIYSFIIIIYIYICIYWLYIYIYTYLHSHTYIHTNIWYN